MTNAVANKPAGTGLIVAGYIFAFLGGLIGIAIGATLKMGKVKDESGNKVFTYDEKSRQHGLYMLIIGVVAMIGWRVIASGMR